MADGTRYEGGWKAGLIEGEGVLVQPNGDRYEGASRPAAARGSAAPPPPPATSTKAASRRPAPAAPAPSPPRTASATPAPGSRAASKARARPFIPTARSTRAASGPASPTAAATSPMPTAPASRATGRRGDLRPGHGALRRRPHLRGRLPRPEPGSRQARPPPRAIPTTASGPRACATGRASRSMPTAPATRAASRRAARRRGKMTMPGGFVFEGTWANGLLNGRAAPPTPTATVYEGEFVGGRREGQGLIRLAAARSTRAAGRPASPSPAAPRAQPSPPRSPPSPRPGRSAGAAGERPSGKRTATSVSPSAAGPPARPAADRLV